MAVFGYMSADSDNNNCGTVGRAGCVSVSIVVHRSPAGQLRHALECLLRSDCVGRVDVVDNSPDESLRDVAVSVDSGGRVRYRHVRNRGFGAAHNLAIRDAMADGYEYHLVMNADVWWDGDVVGLMAGFMRRRPEAGMSMPRVRYPDGKLQYACRLLPTPFDVFAKRFLPEKWIRRRMRRYLLADADHHREFNPPYLLGSFLFFRMDALRETGLFDERFFMYPEDIDITRRIHKHSKTLFFPDAEIVHEHAAASRRSGKMLRIHVANMIRYFNKWGWFADRERRRFNRMLLEELPRTGCPEDGRG